MRNLLLSTALLLSLASPARAWEIGCGEALCGASEVYELTDGSTAALMLGLSHAGEPILALDVSRWRAPAGELRRVILAVDGAQLEGGRGISTAAGIIVPLGAADLDRIAAGRTLLISTPIAQIQLTLTGSRRAIEALRQTAATRRQLNPWGSDPAPAPAPRPEGPAA